MYNPYDWYWLDDDGHLYSSKRQIITTVEDADYIEWKSLGQWNGHYRQNWPRNLDGEQTTASLQEVVTPYGFIVPEFE